MYLISSLLVNFDIWHPSKYKVCWLLTVVLCTVLFFVQFSAAHVKMSQQQSQKQIDNNGTTADEDNQPLTFGQPLSDFLLQLEDYHCTVSTNNSKTILTNTVIVGSFQMPSWRITCAPPVSSRRTPAYCDWSPSRARNSFRILRMMRCNIAKCVRVIHLVVMEVRRLGFLFFGCCTACSV